MEILLAIVIGSLYAAGVYMILRRSLVKLFIGLTMLGYASNLLLFAVGDLFRGQPPLIPAGETALTGQYADPIPQALILTAIVIGFGAQAFAIVLLRRVYHTIQTDDIDKLTYTDQQAR